MTILPSGLEPGGGPRRVGSRGALAAFRGWAVAFAVLVVAISCGGNSDKPTPRRPTADAGVSGAGVSGSGAGAEGGQPGTDVDAGPGGAASVPDGGGGSPVLVAIAVEPAEANLLIDGRVSLRVVGTYSNDVTEDLTSLSELVSGNPAVAVVSSYFVTGVAAGTAIITARVGEFSSEATITVEAKTVTAVTVTLGSSSLAAGEVTGARAQAVMDDGTTEDVTSIAVWTSSDPKAAWVSNVGFVLALGSGTTSITASMGDIDGSARLRVTGETLTSFSIEGPRVLRVGDSGRLVLQAHYANRVEAQASASFRSSNQAVLSVSSDGRLEALSPGRSTISAFFWDTFVASVEVVVPDAALQSLVINAPVRDYWFCEPPLVSVIGTFSDGASYDVTHLVDWGASDGVRLEFGLGTVRLEPDALGTAEVTASIGEVTAVAEFTALLGTPTEVALSDDTAIPVSSTFYLFATAYCADQSRSVDATEAVTWSSDSPSIATVSNSRARPGVVRGIGSGTTLVRATLPGFVIDPVVLTVYDAAISSVELDPDDGATSMGETIPMQAYGVYEDGLRFEITASCVWSTTVPSVATISNSPDTVGFLTAVSAGVSLVSARCGAITRTTRLTVF